MRGTWSANVAETEKKATQRMRRESQSHVDRGLKRVLSIPRAYQMLGRLLLRRQTVLRHVTDFIRPFPGCRILDIGCGPADILDSLPTTIGEYVGFDMNFRYIEAARRRWGARGRFIQQEVREATVVERDYYDRVLATSILHHLDDQESSHLFRLAREVLRPGGTLITYDNVLLERQHWFARFLIQQDRGRRVRTVEGYRQLARSCFQDVEGAVLHDTLRVPYSIWVMICRKP